MLLGTAELPPLAGQVTLASGGFDPLHPGHVRYLEAAAQLGLPVVVSIAPDSFVRSKHAPLLSQGERAVIIDALRPVSYTHAADVPTADVLAALTPRYWAKGADWAGSIPADELAVAESLGIEVVILDTVSHSSSAVIGRFLAAHEDMHAR